MGVAWWLCSETLTTQPPRHTPTTKPPPTYHELVAEFQWEHPKKGAQTDGWTDGQHLPRVELRLIASAKNKPSFDSGRGIRVGKIGYMNGVMNGI